MPDLFNIKLRLDVNFSLVRYFVLLYTLNKFYCHKISVYLLKIEIIKKLNLKWSNFTETIFSISHIVHMPLNLFVLQFCRLTIESQPSLPVWKHVQISWSGVKWSTRPNSIGATSTHSFSSWTRWNTSRISSTLLWIKIRIFTRTGFEAPWDREIKASGTIVHCPVVLKRSIQWYWSAVSSVTKVRIQWY